MRLLEFQQKVIIQAILNIDPEAKIYLFGSRVDDAQRGGDIDIMCFSKLINRPNIRAIKRRIWDQIGEQKIDLIVEQDMSKPFTRLVMKDAIELK